MEGLFCDGQDPSEILEVDFPSMAFIQNVGFCGFDLLNEREFERSTVNKIPCERDLRVFKRTATIIVSLKASGVILKRLQSKHFIAIFQRGHYKIRPNFITLS